MQESVGNEENGYSVPDPPKMIKVTKDPSNAHKNTPKEEIFQEITEKFMEKIPDTLSQNVQNVVKKFQDTKNKEHEKNKTNK
jgi:hypothetical protein